VWHWGQKGAAVVSATAEDGSTGMPEEPDDDEAPLTHDLPCVRCGHAAHPYLVCGSGCDCQPTRMPGQGLLTPH
jgi:hypothetical protein